MDSGGERISSQTIMYKNQYIGGGAFGKVYLGHYSENQNGVQVQHECCVKLIQKTTEFRDTSKAFEREQELSNKVKESNNPNIVKVFEVVETQNSAYIVMEKCDEDLENFFQKFNSQLTFDQIKQISKEILNGYKILERQSIIHRDIKFENILLKDNVAKISDFGMGRVLKRAQEMNAQLTRVGTPLYAAPQLFTNEPYTQKVDMYSVGVLIYRLIYGQYPINEKNVSSLRTQMANLKNQPIVCPESNNSSPQMRKYVEAMLRHDEKDRPLWSQLYNSDGLTKTPTISIVE